MGNSALVKYTKISANRDTRTNSIKKITIHHMAGNLSIESCGQVFQTSGGSSNYGVGSDGRIGMYVEEKDRSYCTSDPANDHQAINIEIANSQSGGNWPVSDTAYNAAIDLVVDVCWRNNISSLSWTGSASGTLNIHKHLFATECPGPYLEAKMPDFKTRVNARLSSCASIKSSVITQTNALQTKGIINTASYWTENFTGIEYLGDFLIKLGQAQYNTWAVELANVEAAIDRLASKNITSSPDYWKANYKRLPYLGDLIMNAGKRISML